MQMYYSTKLFESQIDTLHCLASGHIKRGLAWWSNTPVHWQVSNQEIQDSHCSELELSLEIKNEAGGRSRIASHCGDSEYE